MEIEMPNKTYCTLSAALFLLIGLVHVIRLLVGFTFQIGSLDLPSWVSAVGAIIMLFLAWSGFKSARTATGGV